MEQGEAPTMPVQDTARRRACSIAAAALAASLVALPAAAQWFGEPGYAPIPPRAVVGMLYGQGFRQVGRPRWVGDRYLVEGVDRYGIPVRLAMDPTGDVLGRRNLAAANLVPPRNVGSGPIRGEGPREFGRVEPFGQDVARSVFAPASPRREADRRGERLQRQAARPEARPAAPHLKPTSPVEARAPDPSAAKPAATAPVEPAPRPAQPGPVATRAAPEPARPEPAASPAAPIPSVEALRPEAPRESPTAAAAPNVRVIEGVTPVVPRQPAEVSEPEPPAPVD
jgi:hypothetical protein